MPIRRLVLPLLLLCSCAGKLPLIYDDNVLPQVNAHYRAFYPAPGDPDQGSDAGLLRPRFGLPAIVRTGDPFPVEVLERGGPPAMRAALLSPGVTDRQAGTCLAGTPVPGCYPLQLDEPAREPLGRGAALAVRQARPAGAAPPPGGYDLYLASPADPPTRVPRAVWLRADDPAGLSQLSVVHLSDLHVGKGPPGVFLARLRSVISDVNAVAPDLVVITGDVIHRGQDLRLAHVAQDLLLGLEAPVLVVMGNHDLEFPKNPLRVATDAGWPNFARVFHPFREFKVTLGGYDFIGFDSGPAERSPRVLVRGLAPVTVERLRAEVRESDRLGRRGVVLFSHAPSRASISAHAAPGRQGYFGRMHAGVAAFEGMMLEAAARGQRVLHLAGHTHWSDVFEAEQKGASLRFDHWPLAAISPCPHAISGKAAIITTQAASHSGAFFKKSGRGYGFAVLLLGDGDPEVAFHRYGVPQPAVCPTI